MFCVSLRRFPNRVIKLSLVVICGVAFLSVPPARSFAQKPVADTSPQFSDFKGVHIGMPTEEVRKKLTGKYKLKLEPPFRCDFHDPWGNRIQVVDLHDESLIWLLPYREMQKAGVKF